MDALSLFQFLRPQWLWALLGLPVLAWLWRRRARARSVWREAVDAHLLPHLLVAPRGARGAGAIFVALLAYALAVLALAGPSWRQVEQPVWRSRAPLVIALDLSSAATATDLPPTRLAQVRAKLGALLARREGGQVALVAFADDAYTVSPLTDDRANVALYLDALRPDVMPVDGRRADRAIRWSRALLERAGFRHGDILLLTDGADDEALQAAREAAGAGYRVSVLGVGTAAGANYRRRDGALLAARLDAASLRALAAAGDGRFTKVTPDARDLQALDVLDADGAASAAARGRSARVPQDDGIWLLPPLMLLALFAFRRHAGALVLVLVLVLALGAMPLPSYAQASWWQRPDQAAHVRIEAGNRAYRAGDYERAARLYAGVDSAVAHYNRGNALARAGRYHDAIAAYDRALARQPRMTDAIANRRAVQALLRRQPPAPPQDQRGRTSRQPGAQRPGESGTAAESTERRTPAQRGQGAARAPQPPRTPPADARTRQAAEAAQRARMDEALRRGGRGERGKPEQRRAPDDDSRVQRERRLANEAWLKRVPDDPGSLLAEKFRLEHERRQLQGEVER
ncbi:MAG TPA: VWA domain-containing protein [Lysobacter sp.]|nr:VWA domain-containing protein [Lysobacter sp.]